ncbi:hypothetical protein TIFTF001_020326 [Ficus carica]|uniref:Uncharacterized protein n=1 Tax=Ficus carica TaxID=3494 RepID=A0AA88AXU0_FICCA|nr:hypothetical protein TIFTF001_020326 [Ficus carica]
MRQGASSYIWLELCNKPCEDKGGRACTKKLVDVQKPKIWQSSSTHGWDVAFINKLVGGTSSQ